MCESCISTERISNIEVYCMYYKKLIGLNFDVKNAVPCLEQKKRKSLVCGCRC